MVAKKGLVSFFNYIFFASITAADRCHTFENKFKQNLQSLQGLELELYAKFQFNRLIMSCFVLYLKFLTAQQQFSCCQKIKIGISLHLMLNDIPQTKPWDRLIFPLGVPLGQQPCDIHSFNKRLSYFLNL